MNGVIGVRFLDHALLMLKTCAANRQNLRGFCSTSAQVSLKSCAGFIKK